MAYKRTTKSVKNGGTTSRTTTTKRTGSGQQTISHSIKHKNSTFTQNNKGETWLTIKDGNGYIHKRKLNKKQPKTKITPTKKAKADKTPIAVTAVIGWSVVLILILLFL